MNVKNRLKELMDERGWTTYRLSKETGVPASTLRDILQHDAAPSTRTLQGLCDGLHISQSQFFDVESQIGLSDEERRILFRWGCLSAADRDLVEALIDRLAAGHK